MADLFGDTSLFEEFEKDREADASFIRYDENSVKSRIIFEGFDSDEEPESDDDWEAEILPPRVTIHGVEPECVKEAKKAKAEEKQTADDAVQNGEKEIKEENEENKDPAEQNGEAIVEAKETKDEEKTEDKEVEDKEESNSDKNEKIDEENNSKDGKEKASEDKEKSTKDQSDKNEKEDGEIEMETDEKKSKKETETEIKKPVQTVKTPLLPLPSKVASQAVPKIKEKAEEKINPLDDEDTAWLYEHLYNKKTSVAAKPNLQQLKYERNKYHRFCKILDSTRYVPDEGSPAVQLLFNNNTFARKYRQQIEQFIKGLLWQEFNSNNQDTSSEIDARSSAPSCVDINEKLGPEQRNEAMRQKHVLLGNCQFHRQFLIDFLGWPFTIKEPLRCNINWEIPLYAQIFDEVYADPSVKPKKPVKKTKPACWNCGQENCSVAMCRMPRNQTRIQNNRREFMEQQQDQPGRQPPKFTGASRYHLDPEIASKYAKYRPGNMSEPLREALGLASHQLPQHVYKMRLYGYPPGWLAKAKQVESGVAIFDKDGKEELNYLTKTTGDHLEDGEVEEKNEYDVSKIIEYPGFTIPTPEGVVDDHENFKMPPIQEHQLKKTLQEQSDEKIASRKRKREEKIKEEEEAAVQAKKAKTEISEEANLNTNNSAVKEEAMDEKEASEESNKEETTGEEAKDGEAKEGETKEGETNGEGAKEPAEKEDDADSNATEPCDDVKMEEVNEETNGKDTADSEPDAKDDSVMQPPETPSTPKTAPPATPTSASTRSLSRDYGTPILVRQKSGLPDASKFMAGTEEHIPFENLPGAEGNYDKMRSLIDTIRQKKK